MIGKILLTIAVIIGAALAVRSRWADETRGRARAPRPPPLLMRALAYGLVVVMLSGSIAWLLSGRTERGGIVTIDVINANTGAATTYRAYRKDVAGRHFTTLDGRRVVLADIERMVLNDEE